VTLPATAEEPAEPGNLRGKTPLEVTVRASKDGRFGDHAAFDLTYDPLKLHTGKRADVFEHKPRTGMSVHPGKHLGAEVLVAVIAAGLISFDELTTGNAGSGVPVPLFSAQSAQRADAIPRCHLQRMVARWQICVELQRIGGFGSRKAVI
jgi:hypothetical protein